MQIKYIHAHSLAALYNPLSEQLHADRQKLLPQTPQTIVVGNLDTEGYLQRRLVEEDGVLMGVNFPFLESAIENFSARIRSNALPKVNESWFTPAANIAENVRSFTMLDLEMVLLGILQNPVHEAVLSALGYQREQLTPVRMVALSQKLAGEWYDYLLHIPESLRRLPAQSGAAVLWKVLSQTLLTAGYNTPLLTQDSVAERPAKTEGAQSGLILFGMPILSAYHLRVISEIGRVTPVTFYATDFSDLADSTDSLLQAIGQKYRRYRAAFENAAKSAGVTLVATAIADSAHLTSEVQVAALPGLWRAAEIIGDICHERLIRGGLRQTDISISLHNAEVQFVAFERAFGMRTLTATSRAVTTHAPDALVELWQIFIAAATSGVDREILMHYWQNPVSKEALKLTDEEIDNYRLALERAQGFGSDYEGAFSAYSLESALGRLTRSMFFEADGSARQTLRIFDSPERSEQLIHSILRLEEVSANLNRHKGAKLFEAMHEMLQTPGIEKAAEKASFSEMLRRIEAIPGSEFFAPAQIISAIERHTPGKDLRFNQRADGISFAAPGATAFSRRLHILFDLNDKATVRDDDLAFMIKDFRDATTRLSADEQLAIALTQAIFSGAEDVILAYSNIEAKSGAEFYPSQVLTRFEKSLYALKTEIFRPGPFAATVIDTEAAVPPPAADHDVETILRLLPGAQQKKRKLTDMLLAEENPNETVKILTLRELHAFVMNPALHILSQRVTLPEEPAEFSFTEPVLAFGKSARTRFCEEYVEAMLLAQSPRMTPVEYVTRRQNEGELPSGGFDQAFRLLGLNDNAGRLAEFTEDLTSRFERIDIFFVQGIATPFIKSDGKRIRRYYVPAPEINGVAITGQLEKLWLDTASGVLSRIGSGIYKKRLPQIVELHLALCLITAAGAKLPRITGLAYAEFAIDSPKKNPDKIEYRLKEVCKIDLADFDCGAYLADLLESLATREVFWFDMPSLSVTVFGNLVDQTEKQLVAAHEADSEFLKRPARSVFLKRFFDLSADARSFAFFNQFVRPLAAANAAANKPKPKTNKRGAK